MTPYCPHCSAILSRVEVNDTTLTVRSRPKWKGLIYSCPICHKALSVDVNPHAVREDILNDIRQLLARG